MHSNMKKYVYSHKSWVSLVENPYISNLTVGRQPSYPLSSQLQAAVMVNVGLEFEMNANFVFRILLIRNIQEENIGVVKNQNS